MTLIAHKINRTSWEDKVHLVSNHISFTMENMELRKQCKNRKKKKKKLVAFLKLRIQSEVLTFTVYTVIQNFMGQEQLAIILDVEKQKIQNNHEQATLVEKSAP